MSDSLIDVETFYEEFFQTGEDGESGSTTLLYRIRLAGLLERDELLYKMGCLSLQCEQWKRLENDDPHVVENDDPHVVENDDPHVVENDDPHVVENDDPHVEAQLIKQVYELLQKHKCRLIGIDIVLNYSPCAKCASDLITLKQEIEKIPKIIVCDMNIKFASFYKHFSAEDVEALVEMARNQIQLTVFNGLCDWKEFLDNTVNLNLDIQSERFFDDWLKQRETALVNSAILRCIKESAFLLSTHKSKFQEEQKSKCMSLITQITKADAGLTVLKYMREQFPDKLIQDKTIIKKEPS